MTHVDTSPAPPSPCTHLHLELELEPGSDSALLRVVSILHRRRCRVIEASFRGDEGACDRLALQLQAPRRVAPTVADWLGALVDVRRAVVAS